MAESFFVEPAINGPITAPAVENSSVRVDSRAGGLHVDSQSIHRSHSLLINPLSNSQAMLRQTSRPGFSSAAVCHFSLYRPRRRWGFAPHLYQPCKNGPAHASLLQEQCLYFCAFPCRLRSAVLSREEVASSSCRPE